MFPVSDEYLKAVKGESRIFPTRIKLDGKEEYLTNKNIRTGAYTNIIDGNSVISMGNACANMIEMSVINFDTDYAWKGSRFSCEKGLKVNGVTEWVPWGTFWVSEMRTSNDKRTVHITAYDYMLKLSKRPYVTALVAPFHYRDLLDEFLSNTAMTLSASVELPERDDADYILSWPEGDFTYSDIAGHLAGLIGCNARISAADPTVLEFVWYEPNGIVIKETLAQGGFERLADSPLRVDYLVISSNSEIEIENTEGSTNGELDFRPFDTADPADYPWLVFTYDAETLTASVQLNSSYASSTAPIVIPYTVLYNDEIYDVTSIPTNGFKGSKATEIVLPEKLQTIGAYAFADATGLTSMVIPENVTTINSQIFSGCSNLKTLYYNAENAETTSNASCFRGGITTVIVGEGVVSIPGYAFRDMSAITHINLPNTVQTIGAWAFAGTGIESLVIPESVTKIYNQIVSGCSNLKTIYYEAIAAELTSAYTFDGCPATDVIVGLSVQKLPNNLFRNHGKLENINIPTSVTYVGAYAFYGCKALKSIAIPGSVETVSSNAFYSCKALSSLTLGEGIKVIDGYAFYDCDALTSVLIPNSVKTISGNSFCGCATLASVQIGTSADCAVTGIATTAFSSCAALSDITIYKKANGVSGSPWGASNATISWVG